MSLTSGTKLGPYEIIAPLGARTPPTTRYRAWSYRGASDDRLGKTRPGHPGKSWLCDRHDFALVGKKDGEHRSGSASFGPAANANRAAMFAHNSTRDPQSQARAGVP